MSRDETSAASAAAPAPLCGHPLSELRKDGYRARCSRCGSFWDQEALAPLVYDHDYSQFRSHFDERIGALKVATMNGWLSKVGVDPAGQTVCEVGFGGGFCLRELHRRARIAFGVEENPAAIAHATEIGVPAERLHRFSARPARLAEPVDLWIFQDSFEHLPSPGEFADWLAANSKSGARILLVAPEAGSASDRLLGRAWPHKVRDHQFHWSREGLRSFWADRGFGTRTEFHPGKVVSTRMLAAHALHKLGMRASTRWLPDFALRFNFGQMGLLFGKGTHGENESRH